MGQFVSRLIVPPQAHEAMVAHSCFSLPEEGCGLLAGSGNTVVFVYPLTNAEHSPISYTIEPYEHFRAWGHAEQSGWELIGTFHSHPAGPTNPSATDLALSAEPDWFYLIVAAKSIRAFQIRERRAYAVEIAPFPWAAGTRQ